MVGKPGFPTSLPHHYLSLPGYYFTAIMAGEPSRKKQMTTKEKVGRVQLPGFGMELEQESNLPIALDWYASPTTVHERAIIGLMLALKDKPEWDRKVFDEEIASKWRKEATAWRLERGSHASSFGGQKNPWNGSDGNGVNLDIDGIQRQKDINEPDFDYVSLPRE